MRVSGAKSATPVNVAGPSSRRTVRLGEATMIKDEESWDDEEPPPGNQAVLSGSVNGTRKGRATPLSKESEGHKRKRGPSVESTSPSTSLPVVVPARKSIANTPPPPPRKKRRLDSAPSASGDRVANGRTAHRAENEEEVVLKNTPVVAFEEEEESSGDDEIILTSVPSTKTKFKSRLEQKIDTPIRVNRPKPVGTTFYFLFLVCN